MEHRVFISYAREDRDFVRRVATDLRDAGVNVWLDQIDIKSGELWDQAVEAALTSSSAVIVILTPASVSSRLVLDEVMFALEENKTVTPALCKPCAIPFRLRRLHYADFTTDYSAGLSELIRAVAIFTSNPPPKPSQKRGAIPGVISPPQAPAERRTKIPFDKSILTKWVVKTLTTQLGVAEKDIVRSAKLVDDLGVDSLDTVELIMAAEEEFDVEISDDEAEKILTVGQGIDFLANRLER